MTIRPYTPADKEKCLEIFRSNCPQFFDNSELALFDTWLNHQSGEGPAYHSPTYTDSEKDAYFVLETPENGLIGCGGFYIVKKENEARLAWGMIHAGFHHRGYGTQLYRHRYDCITRDWPGYKLTMGTSQHTFPFYEKMGLQVTRIIPSGYGETLDRYDMTT